MQLLQDYGLLFFYLLPIALVLLWRSWARRRASLRQQTLLEENRKSGLLEPASLHPNIDQQVCIGCGSCAAACPEGDVIGLINDRAELINPTHCIGHGACAAACPVQAITLVFGSEKRGVDIPTVDKNFETNVPGLFIAGELGGMGLIRNAVEQGRQALEAIRKKAGIGTGNDLDILIVGAGPAGFSATLAAHQHKLRYWFLAEVGNVYFGWRRPRWVYSKRDVRLTQLRRDGNLNGDNRFSEWLQQYQEQGTC